MVIVPTPIRPRIRLDVTLHGERRAVLARLFSEVGFDLSEDADAVVTNETSVQETSSSTSVIALYSGKLRPEHATLFTDSRSTFLCASRSGEEVPSHWETQALSSLMRNRSIPS